MTAAMDELLGDLVAEYDRLEAILTSLTADEWLASSGVAGWTIRDVVHLAQTEEGVAYTLAEPSATWTTRDQPLDAAIEANVRTDRSAPGDVLARWQAARRSSVAALAEADPDVAVRWAAAPLRPRTLATTRLAEHWAHALDVCYPLGQPLPDTDRLRHIAWLGHSTLPYAFRLAGVEPYPVRATLRAPSGAEWVFGPADAEATISGDAGAFCRVGARRLAGAESGLAVSGPAAARALDLLRNYAA
jgi:uncharacterized protein (TIGR03084 family)